MTATIKMIDGNMKFYETPVKNLREDFVFSLIQNKQMSIQQFAAWVEGVRDEWFLNGLHSSTSEVNLDHDTSPQSVSSSIEFF